MLPLEYEGAITPEEWSEGWGFQHRLAQDGVTTADIKEGALATVACIEAKGLLILEEPYPTMGGRRWGFSYGIPKTSDMEAMERVGLIGSACQDAWMGFLELNQPVLTETEEHDMLGRLLDCIESNGGPTVDRSRTDQEIELIVGGGPGSAVDPSDESYKHCFVDYAYWMGS